MRYPKDLMMVSIFDTFLRYPKNLIMVSIFDTFLRYIRDTLKCIDFLYFSKSCYIGSLSLLHFTHFAKAVVPSSQDFVCSDATSTFLLPHFLQLTIPSSYILLFFNADNFARSFFLNCSNIGFDLNIIFFCYTNNLNRSIPYIREGVLI